MRSRAPRSLRLSPSLNGSWWLIWKYPDGMHSAHWILRFHLGSLHILYTSLHIYRWDCLLGMSAGSFAFHTKLSCFQSSAGYMCRELLSRSAWRSKRYCSPIVVGLSDWALFAYVWGWYLSSIIYRAGYRGIEVDHRYLFNFLVRQIRETDGSLYGSVLLEGPSEE